MPNNYLLTSDGELYHWKYIKREKVNGKWRYYYTDTEYEKAKKRAEIAKQQSDSAYRMYRAALDAHTKATKNYFENKNRQTANEYIRTHDAKERARKYDVEKLERSSSATVRYRKAKASYDKSAGHKVADLLNKSSDAIDKAKKWLSDRF